MKRILSREFYALLSHDVATNRDGKIFYTRHGTGIFVPLEDLLVWFETVEATAGLAIPDWRYKGKDMAYEEEINKGHWMDLWLLHGLCPEAGTPVPAGEGVRCPKCGNLRECEACFPGLVVKPPDAVPKPKHATNEEGDCAPWCPACGPVCEHGGNSLECEACKTKAADTLVIKNPDVVPETRQIHYDPVAMQRGIEELR
jgi:hypothetical protein